MIAYIGRHNYPAIMVRLIADGLLTKPQAGLVGTALFMAYGIGQLPAGWLSDRLSPRILIAVGLAGSALANGLFATLPAFSLMLACACLNGLSQSLLWSPLVRSFSDYYRPRTLVRVGILIETSVPAGTLAAYGLAAAMVAWQRPRLAFALPALLLGLAAVVWFWLSGRVARHAAACGEQVAETAEAAKRREAAGGFAGMMGPALIGLAILLVLRGMLREGITTWTPVYLSELHGLAEHWAILATTLMPLLSLAAMGLVSRLMRRSDEELGHVGWLYAASTALLALLFLVYGRDAGVDLGLLTAVTVLMMAINTLAVVIFPRHFVATGQVGLVSGLLNFLVYVGTALSSYGFGALTLAYGWRVTLASWLLLALVGSLAAGYAAWQWRRRRRARED